MSLDSVFDSHADHLSFVSVLTRNDAHVARGREDLQVSEDFTAVDESVARADRDVVRLRMIDHEVVDALHVHLFADLGVVLVSGDEASVEGHPLVPLQHALLEGRERIRIHEALEQGRSFRTHSD